jgi:small subunit ribosomal protein S16
LAVRVRLTRVGSKKNPIWRVVVADQRSPRDGRIIETIGRYNAQTEPSEIVIDRERLQHWLDRGAQPSETVLKLIRVVERGGETRSASRPEPPATQARRRATPEPAAETPAEPAAEPAAEASAAEEPAAQEPAAGESAADEQPPAAEAQPEER